jgi:FkbM family methyltransferase
MAVNRQVPNPLEPHPAEVRPDSNGLDISQPDHPLYHRIGRRCLRLIRPFALTFLAQLHARLSSRVDASNAALALLFGHCRDRITLVDVGARWGAHDRWDSLGNLADIVCFEPDREECERLQASRAPNTRYLPIGLSDSGGERDLFVTVEPGCSSNFEPIPALYEHYPSLGIIRPLRKTRMLCRRLDDVLAEHGVSQVAALKLDTQGSELLILKGAERTLAKCSLIDIEVEFNPLYQQQALFCDVDRFLRDRGFVLWRLENLFHYSTESLPAAESMMEIVGTPAPAPRTVARIPNGQVFWAQAQYVRKEYPRAGADYMESSEAIVPAILAGTYGWWDLALELVRKTGDRALSDDLRATLAQ